MAGDDQMARVADEARQVARGWSGPAAPDGWALTAALFEALAGDDLLLELAVAIPSERLPALLFVASVQYLAAELDTEPLAQYYPRPGRPGRRPDDQFAGSLRDFCRRHRHELESVWSGRRYQMNEVARCTQVALALGRWQSLAPGRELALVDVGTGAGLGLSLDRYTYSLSDGRRFGAPDAEVTLMCQLEGPGRPPVPAALPIRWRVGIDARPVGLGDHTARRWLAACTPPDSAAQDRLSSALAVARTQRAPVLAGDAIDLLPGVLDRAPDDLLLSVVDTYTAVFFDDAARQAMADIVTRCARRRDIAWISLDPLVPLGTEARHSVQNLEVPAALIERNRLGGVFALLTMSAVVGGSSSSHLLAAAHPSGTQMEWLEPPSP